VNLTNNPDGDYYSPGWSPDGKQIVYVSSRSDSRNYDVYVMKADGSNPTNLTNQGGLNVSPDWSPDGQRITFVSDRDGKSDIYVMNADGSHVTRLTTSSGDKTFSTSPVWSPDGRQIAFTSNRDGQKSDIYVMNADGSDPVRLTNTPDYEEYPRWSPDGRTILLMVVAANSRTTNEPNHIDRMNADGSNRVTLADGFGPAWVIESFVF
jgi:Tol biopolymer transport system component